MPARVSRINLLLDGNETGPLVKRLVELAQGLDGKRCPVCGRPLVNLTPREKRVRARGRTLTVQCKYGHRMGEGCLNRIYVKLTLKAGGLLF